jgi:hypothetical protein
MGNYTLGDIRNMTTKLLNEYQTTTSLIDISILNRIDESVNLCYQELSQKDKIASSVAISQFPIANMLGETFSYDTHTTTSVSFVAASAYAYYYECDGAHSVDILEGSSTATMTTLSTVTVTAASTFAAYRDFVTAAVSSDYIKLEFYGDQEYRIKNAALYPYTFGNSTAAIPAFKPYVEYALPSDYSDINKVRYRANNEYGTLTDYRIDGGNLLISRGYSAEFFLDYWIIPSAVTTATNTFLIKDRTALIIPYGVAGDILIGNGINVGQGQAFKAEYEKKLKAIDTSTEHGKQTISNTRRW